MGRQVRDTRFETREARLRLKVQHEPYWRLIHGGLHLGYRKGARGGNWVLRIQLDGKYRKKVLGMADDTQDCNGHDILSFREAQEKAIALADEQLRPALSAVTVAHAAERYLAWYKEHRKSYIETRATITAHILPTFGKRPIAELSTREIKLWLNKLATQPARKRTGLGSAQQYKTAMETPDAKRARKSSANRILTVLKALLNKAYEDELVNDDTAWRRVKPFENVDEPIVRFLNTGECLRLIHGCRPDLALLVRGALLTGARYSELAGLTVGSLQADTQSLYFSPGKSGKGRFVPLNAEGIAFFTQLCAHRSREEPLFLKSNGTPWGKNHHVRALQEACEVAGITPSVSFHELRHTYASLLAQAGADLLTISKLLGHADTRITSRHYAHLCDKTLARAVMQHLPNFGG